MKILILKPSSLGDVVQAIPVLRLLKLRYPESEIHWWISTDLVPLLEGDPDLAGVIPFDRQRWVLPQHWNELFQSIRRMRRQHFNYVIDLQSLARSGVVAWLVRGNLTIGLDDRREGAPGFYDVVVARPSYDTHAVDWYLQVLKQLDIPIHWNFDWLPERKQVARTIRERWPDPPGANTQWIILHPGARWLNKRWPVASYAGLVRMAAEEFPAARFAILGANGDQALSAEISAAGPDRCIDLIGKTTLAEMVEWIRRCTAMVSNDTGPMHVAAALHKPVMAIFGATEPHRTGPYGQLDSVLQATLSCVPCMNSVCHREPYLECMKVVTPSMVMKSLLSRLPAFSTVTDNG